MTGNTWLTTPSDLLRRKCVQILKVTTLDFQHLKTSHNTMNVRGISSKGDELEILKSGACSS